MDAWINDVQTLREGTHCALTSLKMLQQRLNQIRPQLSSALSTMRDNQTLRIKREEAFLKGQSSTYDEWHSTVQALQQRYSHDHVVVVSRGTEHALSLCDGRDPCAYFQNRISWAGVARGEAMRAEERSGNMFVRPKEEDLRWVKEVQTLLAKEEEDALALHGKVREQREQRENRERGEGSFGHLLSTRSAPSMYSG